MATFLQSLTTAGKSARRRREEGIFLFLTALGMLLLFRPTLSWMNQRFFEENSYYSHGWLIPAAIAFLLWQRREAIAQAKLRICWWGLGIVLVAALVHLGAQLIEVNFVSGWALLGLLLGMVLFRGGPELFRLVAGPLGLMVFMIPLPGIWLISIAFDLKTFSSDIGVGIVRVLGIEVILDGIEVILPGSPPGETLKIGDPCSGLHSLLSFGSLGGFFSLLLPLKLWKRTAVFVTAVLLAPISNLIRVSALIALRRTIGPQILSGPWHIALGLVVFFFCFLIFLQVVRWLLD